MGHRIIIFAEPRVPWVPSLLNAIVTALEERSDLDWVKVCATSQEASRIHLVGRSLSRFAVKALFNPRMAANYERPRMTTVTSVANSHGVELIRPPNYSINDPGFIRDLQARYRPTMALSLACLQIWSAELLEIFDLAVNFHNGYLPDYKGLWATHWSLYNGERFSGYAFHVMDAGIDTGPIIIRDRVPVKPDDSPIAVDRRKIKSARANIEKLLDAMISGSFDSMAQEKGGSYFSGRASVRLWTIDDPRALTANEFFRRLRCFAPLKIRFGEATYPVTSLRQARGRRWPLSFVTADGVTLYPDRLQYVPTWLYLAAGKIKDLFFGRPNRPCGTDLGM